MRLQELQPLKYNVLESDRSKLREGVLMKIGGTFQRADTENANKRIYPKELWLDVLQRPEIVERIENRRMLGMLGHPASGVTDPEKVSHVVTVQELKSDGTIYGEAEILDTPTGRVADTLFRAGIGWGISSRGDGSIEQKGGKNEVQNDYRLETYDLVVRPSTPGAYPGMLAETTIEENEKLVAEAIEGLVNSEDIPTDLRVGVLTECLKILSVLEAQDSGDRIAMISSKIQEELKSETVRRIEAKESVQQPGFVPQSNPEDVMVLPVAGSQNSPQQPANIPQDTLAWHQSQVQYQVGQAVAAKESEIAGLKDVVIKAQREHTETKKRLKAAESLIEEFTAKIKQLEEAGPADAELRERYAAAVELLDEAIKRLPEIGTLGKRCQTLEGLLQASIDSVFESRLDEAVQSHLARIDSSFHESVRPALENCQTPEQVGETFKALMAVSGTTPPAAPREPLPVNEGANQGSGAPPPAASAVPRQRSLSSIIGNRLSKAV